MEPISPNQLNPHVALESKFAKMMKRLVEIVKMVWLTKNGPKQEKGYAAEPLVS